MTTRLTQSIIEKLEPRKKGYWVGDEGYANLRLFVGSSGKKTWYLSYRDASGKKQSRAMGAASILTVAQARERAKDLTGRLVRGEDLKKGKPTPKATLDDFLQEHYEPWVTVQQRTGTATIKMIRSFVFLLEKPIEKFSTLEIEQWRTQRLAKGAKKSTINRLVVALKSSINWGVRHKIIPFNPIADLRPLREDDSDVRVRYLSNEERERLNAALDAREDRLRSARKNHNKWLAERGHALLPNLDDCTFADHLKPLIILSLNTGLRRGSLLQIKWDDVDFVGGNLRILPPGVKNAKLLYVAMNAEVRSVLEAWRKQTIGQGSGLVFSSPKTGGRMKDCRSSWEKILRDANLEDFRWHDMRHDFASQLVMEGVDLNTTRELLGHSDMKMTLRYAHLAPEVKQAAVNKLSAKFGKSKVSGLQGDQDKDNKIKM